MKTKVKARKRITLELTEKEAILLVALADFPNHDAQPECIQNFLADLSETVDLAIDYAGKTALGAGFIGRTSV